MDNLVYIVAINMEVENHVEKAWKYYCNKHNCDFKTIKSQINPKMAPHWERYRVFEYYPNYKNYIYVDADAIVRWDAPNLFNKLTDSSKLYVVKDLGSLEWVHNSIKGYQHLFPDVDLKWWEYFTTGFMKFTKSHKSLFDEFLNFYENNLEEINELQYKTLKKGFDQTLFNYFTISCDSSLYVLPEVYSLGHLLKKDILKNGMFLMMQAYIYQFNGIPKKALPNVINQIWNKIQHKYEH